MEHAAHVVQRFARGELGHCPGGSCGDVWGGVGAGWEGDGDVVGLAGVLAEPGEGGGDFGDLVRVFEIDGKESVVARRPLQWLEFSGEAGDPHWHARLMYRSGKELCAVHCVVLTVVVDRLAGPGGGQDLQ